MTSPKLTSCSKCGFAYDQDKIDSCPNCHEYRFKQSLLRSISETTMQMPLGGKLAMFITSNYAIYAIIEMSFHHWWVSGVSVVIYSVLMGIWVNQKKLIDPSIWFIIIVLMLYLPVLLLILLLVF
jgi:hypothetical protein